MLTLQEYLEVEESLRIESLFSEVQRHYSSVEYAKYKMQNEYFNGENSVILDSAKFYTDVTGKPVKDTFSPNHKIPSNFFGRFVTQQVQYLLGNGVTFQNKETKKKLGTKRAPFDAVTTWVAEEALIHGVGYGFFNLDHVEVFSPMEFIPIWDEDTGTIKAGLYWWRLDPRKPLNITFFELDGYTKYQQTQGGDIRVIQKKRPYKVSVVTTEAQGVIAKIGDNYNGFPVVPMYASRKKRSELASINRQIDSYDLNKSGFANDVDYNFLYWTITNAGGLEKEDLLQFVKDLMELHATKTDDKEQIQAHQATKDTNGRERFLAMAKNDLYDDAMAFDSRIIASGNVTATQIMAAYELLNSKEDKFEFQVTDWILSILELAGIDDDPTYTRSKIVNAAEEMQVLMLAAQYLTSDYVTRKALTILGDGDLADQIIEQRQADDIKRLSEVMEMQEKMSQSPQQGGGDEDGAPKEKEDSKGQE